MWNTNDEMVGQHVSIYTAHGNEETATVIAVSTKTTNIKVRADEDGEIMIGNQWEPID